MDHKVHLYWKFWQICLTNPYRARHLINPYRARHLINPYRARHLINPYRARHLINPYRARHGAHDTPLSFQSTGKTWRGQVSGFYTGRGTAQTSSHNVYSKHSLHQDKNLYIEAQWYEFWCWMQFMTGEILRSPVYTVCVIILSEIVLDKPDSQLWQAVSSQHWSHSGQSVVLTTKRLSLAWSTQYPNKTLVNDSSNHNTQVAEWTCSFSPRSPPPPPPPPPSLSHLFSFVFHISAQSERHAYIKCMYIYKHKHIARLNNRVRVRAMYIYIHKHIARLNHSSNHTPQVTKWTCSFSLPLSFTSEFFCLS